MELRHSPNMVAQGITLSVVNQDGRSPRWPIRDQKALYEKQGIGTNAALMVGHGTVRTRVMGTSATTRSRPTPTSTRCRSSSRKAWTTARSA